MSNNNGYVIKTSSLTKTYSKGETAVRALDSVDFEVKQGEFVSIMGPSGSGKSTLLQIIGCLDRPTSGEYLLDGEHVEKLDDISLSAIRNRKIGFVFQFHNLLPQFDILNNVEIPLLYSGIKRLERRERAKTIIDRMGLADRSSHKPTELSGGQNQRVAIARALVNNPSLILADEPTGSLDSKTGSEIMDVFSEINKSGTTVVIITHEEHIARYTERTLYLFDGKFVDAIPSL